MDSQIQEWGISSDMPEEEIELLIREFGECGISADEQEVGIGPLSHEFGEGGTSADEPEADIGSLGHEFGESGDSSPYKNIRPLFADWGPPAAARKFDDWRASEADIEFGEGGTSADEPEADIGPLDHEFGESWDSSPDKDIRPLFADWGPPAAARKFDEWRASVHEPELDNGPLSHEFGESGDSVRQTEVAIGQGECVETTDKPELDTKTVIPWTTNWWVPADKLKVIPRGTNWWPVPVPADKPEVPKTSVIRTVFYFKMDPPLALGAEWGHGPRKYDCGTCFDELSDHMNSSCPFMALATQFNETKSTGMSLGGKKKGTEKSSRFEAYFPPVLSPAERTAANLMTRRKMNLIRICNYLNFSKVGEIKKLFKKFGRVIHAYIPIPGGNGFVNFVRRVDALTAIKKMNGYEFEGLKLRVVWAYFDASRVDV